MSAPTPTPRDVALSLAADPAPAAIERGPVARLHWRHGLDVDPALAGTVVDTPETPVEWSALLAETHAGLLDPNGVKPLASPSPLGSSVGEALRASPSWQPIADAAQAHPLIARESVTALASVVLDALKRAGAKPATDTRRSLADLAAARAALERARAAAKAATTPEERREALRATIEAQKAEERAAGAVATDHGVATRTGDGIEAAEGALARVAARVEERADATHALIAALGSGTGVGGDAPVSDELLRLVTPNIAEMLKKVGALRAAIRSGRASRHVRGREGMIGVTTGGLDRVADLTTTALAGLAGHLGPEYAALTRLALAESRADVVEKGGGNAHHGDVVVVVDQSGSMQGAREEWARVVALAVILEARGEGRRAALVTYNGAVRASVVVDSAATFASALSALCKRSNGDNNEHAAMREASRLLASMPHGGDPADVLMVTDGQWQAGNLADCGGIERARLRGCFIGGSAPEGADFASAWKVTDAACEGDDGATVAVSIAQTIV